MFTKNILFILKYFIILLPLTSYSQKYENLTWLLESENITLTSNYYIDFLSNLEENFYCFNNKEELKENKKSEKDLHHHHGDEDHNHSQQHHHHDDHIHENKTKIKNFCLHQQILNKTKLNSLPSKINSNIFLQHCPLILHSLATKKCFLDNDDLSETQDNDDFILVKPSSLATWSYAILACLIISLVGLVAVAAIPFMHRIVYNHVLQFLVAMAIGSMSGDALLHLIPHAFGSHNHHHHDHHHGNQDHHHGNQDPHSNHQHQHRHHVWLGLIALLSVFVFFIVERLVGIISESKRKRNKDSKEEKKSKISVTLLPDESGDKEVIGKANLAGKEDERANPSCMDMIMVVHTNKDIKKMASEAENELHKNCNHSDDKMMMVSSSHNHNHHHHHGNLSGQSVASVAWMVIVGDGFHNFADGIAIGSAFASSLQDGLSTSIAVFCHELPHELGDFAMLLAAGMSGKQALIYNVVSSFLCFVGMIVGVSVGKTQDASSWIFVIVAGMFIYIALVDMLPEMKSVSPKEGENPLLHLALQTLGWTLGSTIMLLIALYEHQITF